MRTSAYVLPLVESVIMPQESVSVFPGGKEKSALKLAAMDSTDWPANNNANVKMADIVELPMEPVSVLLVSKTFLHKCCLTDFFFVKFN